MITIVQVEKNGEAREYKKSMAGLVYDTNAGRRYYRRVLDIPEDGRPAESIARKIRDH